MRLTAEEEKVLADIKAKLKVMGHVAILEKDISALEKKVDIKRKKLSELIDILDGKSTVDKKISEKRKTEDPLDLLLKD